MTKTEFVTALRRGLACLPQDDADERVQFYSEMIDDRMEDGLSEEAAVAAIGDAETIAAQIIAQTPLTSLVKETIKRRRRLQTWEIVLLAVGSPLWLSLAIAALAVLVSLYISLWAAIVSLWAVFASLVGCAVGGAAAGAMFLCTDNLWAGLTTLGGALICAGLAVWAFFGCRAATVGVCRFTKTVVITAKRRFAEKEDAQ